MSLHTLVLEDPSDVAVAQHEGSGRDRQPGSWRVGSSTTRLACRELGEAGGRRSLARLVLS